MSTSVTKRAGSIDWRVCQTNRRLATRAVDVTASTAGRRPTVSIGLTSRASECREQLLRMKMDAARWILPMAIGDVDEVTPATLARLVWRHPGLRVMVWF